MHLDFKKTLYNLNNTICAVYYASFSNALKTIVFLLIVTFLFIPQNKVEADATTAWKYYQKMEKLRTQKKFQAAMRAGKKAEAADPVNGWYPAILGNLYHWNLKQPKDASAAYKRAISRNYNEPWMWRSMAQLSWSLKKQDQAENEIQTAIRVSRAKLLKLVTGNSKKKKIQAMAKELASSYGLLAKNQVDNDEYKSGLQTADKGYDVLKRYKVTELNKIDYNLVYARTIGNYWLGHINMAQGKFKKAVIHYEIVKRHLKDNPTLKNWSKQWELSEILIMARTRVKLGNIKPEYIHRLFAMYIRNVDVKFKANNGKIITAKNQISDSQIRRSKIFQGVLKAWVEAWSAGKLSLTFEHDKLNRTIHDIKVDMYGTTESRQPRLESIKPDIGSYLFKKSNKYDTFIYYWNAEGFATTANGGGQLYPYVQYQLSGPLRGYMSMPSNWSKLPIGFNTLLHEFFHTTEAMSGISPPHGFQKQSRNKFLGWRGKGQFSYFRWHYENTLPKVTNDRKIKIASWQNLNFLKRYPDKITKDTFKKNQIVLEKVSIQNRIKANNYYKIAKDKKKTRFRTKQKKLYLKALKSNPYHIGANRELAVYYSQRKKFKKSAKHFQAFVEYAPAVWGYINLAWIYQWKLKQTNEAIPWLKRAIAFDANGEQTLATHQNLGRALLDENQGELALDAFQDCRDLSNKYHKKKRYLECTFWKGFAYGEKLHSSKKAKPLIAEAYENGFANNFTKFYYKKYVNRITASRSMDSMIKKPVMPRSKKPAIKKQTQQERVYH